MKYKYVNYVVESNHQCQYKYRFKVGEVKISTHSTFSL